MIRLLLISCSFLSTAFSTSPNNSCMSDLKFLLESKDMVFYQMLDAIGKPQDGFLTGNVLWPGGVDQCKQIIAYEDKQNDKERFRGRYCMINLPLKNHTQVRVSRMNLTVKIQIGICVPDSCTGSDLTSALWSLISSIAFMPKGTTKQILQTVFSYVDFLSIVCQESEKDTFSAEDWIIISIVAIGITVVLVATVTDYFSARLPFAVPRALMFFSVFQNAVILKSANRTRKYDFFNGIKVIAMHSIVLIHTLNLLILVARSPLVVANTYLKETRNSILGALPLVEVFFFMTGFFVAHELVTNPCLSLGLMLKKFLARYLRVAPSMIVSVLLTIFTFRRNEDNIHMKTNFGNLTILFPELRHFLFVPIYMPEILKIHVHLWYIQADFIYFCFVYILHYVLSPRSKSSFRLAIILFWMPTLLLPSIIGRILYGSEASSKFDQGYLKIIYHSGPYFIGVLFGLFWLGHKDPILKPFSKIQSLFLTVIGLALLVAGKTYNGNTYVYYVNVWAFNMFTFGTVCITYLCLRNKDCLINRFLSWSWWGPLSNLIFSVYLLHPILILHLIGSGKYPLEYVETIHVVLGMGIFIYMFILAVPFAFLFEFPFTQMGTMLKQNRQPNENKINRTEPNITSKNKCQV